MTIRTPTCSILLLAAMCPAWADSVVESFESGNPAGWTYGAPVEFIDPTGGNPDAFLHGNGLDTFAPQPRTGWGVESDYTGDYRAANVTSVGIDLILFDVDFSAEERPLSVILYHDGGTPADFSDDFGAFTVGPENIPLVGEGWKSYDFDIPSQSPTLPDGWGLLPFGGGASPDWDTVITDVSQLIFFYGDPEFFFIFQMWEVGMDNPRICFDGSTPADIVDFNVAFGSHVGGGIAELGQSDDQYLRARSAFGFTAFEPNLMELVVGLLTDNPAATSLDVAVEARINNPGGTAKIRFRNWNTTLFEQVGVFAIDQTEKTHQIEDVNASGFVRGDGRIELSLKNSVIATFSLAGFESFIDRTEVIAN